jgi:murein hydrolase activator
MMRGRSSCRQSWGWVAAGAFLVLGLLVALPAPAQQRSPEEQKALELKRLESDVAAARAKQQQLAQQQKAIHAEVEQLRAQLTVAGRSASENEKALTDLESALRDLETDADDKRVTIALRRAELLELLASSQRLAQFPPVAMLMQPGDPQDAIRAGLIIGGTVPAVQERLQVLRSEFDELAKVDDTVRRQRDRVSTQVRGLAQERTSIAALLKRKEILEDQLDAEADKSGTKLKQLAESAKDLRELLEKLIADRQADERRRAEELGRGAVRREQAASHIDLGDARVTPKSGRTLPVSGKITGAYGQATDVGVNARGLSIETRNSALVLSPAAGKIIFSGPFRGYGLILIVEHRDGYHSLLAGLGRLDATVGRSVDPGEPLGAMGEGGDRAPVLYFELRRQGLTLNPQTWVAAQRAN